MRGKNIIFGCIIKEVYVILAILALIKYQFVNNNIDQSKFNLWYNKDFETKEMYIANKIANKFKLIFIKI